MTADAHAAVAATVPTATRRHIRRAARVVTLAGAIGALGQLLFFGVGLGLNMPLAVVAVLGAAWQLRRPDRPIVRADLWLPAAALVFASFFALRGDHMLLAFDFVAAVALTGLAVAAIAGRNIAERGVQEIGAVGGHLIGWSIVGAVPALASIRRPQITALRARGALLSQVGRGLVIGLPVTVVVIVLFASADAAFAQLLEDITRIDLRLGELPGRLLFAVAVGWLAAGTLAFVADADDRRPQAAIGAPFRVGPTEALTVLVLLDLVFAVFVALQAAYLFGGLDTLALTGMTYAEYARRGFFELVAVAVVAGGTVLVLEFLIRPRPRAYVGAALLLIGLTSVVLASAALRLRLYQEAYGWTELRFYVLTAIAFLAFGLALGARALVTGRSARLMHGLLALGLLVALVVNVIGPVRFVTEANVERALNPSLVSSDGRSGLDVTYLTWLDSDAVGPLVAALPDLDPMTRREIVRALRGRRDIVTTDSWQDWSLSRQVATDAVERIGR